MDDNIVVQKLDWLVIYTKSRQEKKVYALLQKQSVESFLPLRRQRKKWSDRWKWIEIPLFSSYIFVKPDKQQKDRILQIDGIVRYLAFNGKLGLVRQNEIDFLRRVVDSDEKVEVVPDLFDKESEVVISKGYFKGFKGRFIHPDRAGKVAIRIEGIGYSVLISVSRDEVEPVRQVLLSDREHTRDLRLSI
ncbi:MAG: UpxY family transcription antiterminator [Ignavibacteriales bacterium]|nr:UpxY family transcription antiterminator [Ignavibacteriales bacterium]